MLISPQGLASLQREEAGCLRLRKALSPETIFKMTREHLNSSPALGIWGLQENPFSGRLARAAWPRRVSWSHLCGLTGQLDVLQTPQGGD